MERKKISGMWDKYINLTNKQTQPSKHPSIAMENNSLTPEINPDLAAYYHAILFSPVTYTWFNAIEQGGFKSCPGLTEVLVLRHLPKIINTEMVLLHKSCQGVQPTKGEDNTATPDITEPINQVFVAMFDPREPTQNIYTDLCDHFPTISIRLHQYIMILYNYCNDSILADPIEHRTCSSPRR